MHVLNQPFIAWIALCEPSAGACFAAPLSEKETKLGLPATCGGPSTAWKSAKSRHKVDVTAKEVFRVRACVDKLTGPKFETTAPRFYSHLF